jgi:hypothetical protein
MAQCCFVHTLHSVVGLPLATTLLIVSAAAVATLCMPHILCSAATYILWHRLTKPAILSLPPCRFLPLSSHPYSAAAAAAIAAIAGLDVRPSFFCCSD